MRGWVGDGVLALGGDLGPTESVPPEGWALAVPFVSAVGLWMGCWRWGSRARRGRDWGPTESGPSGVTSGVRGFGLGGASGRGGCSGRGARDFGGHNPIFGCNFRRFGVGGPRNGAPRVAWMFRQGHAIGG